MTKEELKLKIENCLEYSEKVLNESGSLIPMIDIEFTDEFGKISLMSVVLANGDNKKARDRFIAGLGLMFGAIKRIGKINEVLCVVMMAEAWFSTTSKAEYNLMHGNVVPPSQDPNRREMLLVTGLTSDGIILMKAKEMFSIEVKGKRHFTLKNIFEMKEEPTKVESNVLNNFFLGYKKDRRKMKRMICWICL